MYLFNTTGPYNKLAERYRSVFIYYGSIIDPDNPNEFLDCYEHRNEPSVLSFLTINFEGFRGLHFILINNVLYKTSYQIPRDLMEEDKSRFAMGLHCLSLYQPQFYDEVVACHGSTAIAKIKQDYPIYGLNLTHLNQNTSILTEDLDKI